MMLFMIDEYTHAHNTSSILYACNLYISSSGKKHACMQLFKLMNLDPVQ